MVNFIFLTPTELLFTGELVGIAGTKSAFRYEYVSETLTVAADMLEPRFGHALVRAAGEVFAIGGYFREDALATAEEYDIVRNTWSKLQAMPLPMNWVQAAELERAAKIFIVAGNSSRVSQFNLQTR
jgi:hypothetical protein